MGGNCDNNNVELTACLLHQNQHKTKKNQKNTSSPKVNKIIYPGIMCVAISVSAKHNIGTIDEMNT